MLIFAYAVLWGAVFGTYYAANTALFSELVPVGSEAQFMSLYYFSANIFTWGPPALYAVINQFLNDQSSALYVLGGFILASLLIFRHIKVDGPRPKAARHDDAQLVPEGDAAI